MSSILAYTDDVAAYLATDSGTFELPSGRIVRLAPKIIALPDVGILVTSSGPFGAAELLETMQEEIVLPLQVAFVAALPRVCRRLRDRARVERPEQESAGLNNVRVVAAIYDPATGPRVVETNSENDYQLGEADGFMQPTLPLSIARRILPANLPRDQDEAVAYFKQARRMTHPGAADASLVAGPCISFRVGVNGVTAEQIAEFPDRVGERADPRRIVMPTVSALSRAMAV